MYKPRFKVVFSNERILSPSGLGIVGGMLAKSDFVKRCNRIPVDKKRSEPQIKNGDILLTYIGLLCQAKTPFEAVNEMKDDPEFYKDALGIVRSIPFDRGGEATALQDFILDLMDRDAVILIRGNHEDLYEELLTEDRGLPYRHHVSNGTYDTALQLTGIDRDFALAAPISFAKAARETPYYQKILPTMIDYYETNEFIFTHGWIPCVADGNGGLAYIGDWRDAPRQMWRQARWLNGMDAVRMVSEEGKTIVCGHWHTSYGHSKYEGKGSELGADADFSPYSASGIIALDACTARSGIVNCIVVEDDDLQ